MVKRCKPSGIIQAYSAAEFLFLTGSIQPPVTLKHFFPLVFRYSQSRIGDTHQTELFRLRFNPGLEQASSLFPGDDLYRCPDYRTSSSRSIFHGVGHEIVDYFLEFVRVHKHCPSVHIVRYFQKNAFL